MQSTKSTENKQEESKEIQECPLCIIDFDRKERMPRLMVCGHGVCDTCINYMKTQAVAKGEVTLLCPFCRKAYDLDKEFALNLPLLEIIDDIRKEDLFQKNAKDALNAKVKSADMDSSQMICHPVAPPKRQNKRK